MINTLVLCYLGNKRGAITNTKLPKPFFSKTLGVSTAFFNPQQEVEFPTMTGQSFTKDLGNVFLQVFILELTFNDTRKLRIYKNEYFHSFFF